MNINGYFIFDGLDTRTLPGVTVVRGQTREVPAREFDVRAIPGRNGDMLIDGRKYPNIEITYHVMMRENVEATFRQLSGFLMSRTNYCKLADSWSADEYYMAYVSQPILPTVSRGEGEGAFEVVFNRKPQRFLTSGDTPAEITSGGLVYLENPTYFPARPQITLKAKGTGSNAITIQDQWLSESASGQSVVSGSRRKIVLWDGIGGTSTSLLYRYVSNGDVVIIDCESRSVYNATRGISLNAITYLTNHDNPWIDNTVFYPDFPVLDPILQTDYANVTMLFQSQYATDVSVLPRWWSV